MDFIKRHYEKLLLLSMLVLFVGIMIYVVKVADEAASVKEADLVVNQRDLNRNIVSVMTPEEVQKQLNVGQVIASGVSDWKPSTQREVFDRNRGAVPGTYSDLVQAAAIAACPHCKNLIPRFYFSNGTKCPLCARGLANVPARPKVRLIKFTEDDIDCDGMPNSFEQSKGLNPNSEADQLTDVDRDGFSNLFEYENGTDPTNPSSRSALWFRLRYVSMESYVLPVRLVEIKTYGDKNKANWTLQFELSTRFDRKTGKVMWNSASSEMLSLNKELTIEDKRYRIADCTANSVTLREVGASKGDELVIQVNKEVYSKAKRLTLEDVGTYPPLRRYYVKMGGILNLGDNRIGRERYKLQRVSESGKVAYFECIDAPKSEDGDAAAGPQNKTVEVTAESEIPEDARIKRAAPAAGNNR